MENLVGKKVKGFGFGSSALTQNYIGKIGLIKSVEGNSIKVQFEDDYWFYPLDQIQPHLVNEYPKVMIVSDSADFRCPSTRVVFMEKNGKFLAWSCAKTIEDAEEKVFVTDWNFAKNIGQTVEITLEEIGRKFGVEPHLIKIL